jgi:hypothetical protein
MTQGAPLDDTPRSSPGALVAINFGDSGGGDGFAAGGEGLALLADQESEQESDLDDLDFAFLADVTSDLDLGFRLSTEGFLF